MRLVCLDLGFRLRVATVRHIRALPPNGQLLAVGAGRDGQEWPGVHQRPDEGCTVEDAARQMHQAG